MRNSKAGDELDKLLKVLYRLRGPQGCPWDRAQTRESLREYILEEAYELFDAVTKEDESKICEELGDLLLQILLQSVIAEEMMSFSLEDVVKNLKLKLVRRHPHVFKGETADTVEDVLKKWEKAKKEEGGEESGADPLFRELPAVMPALFKAYKIQKKAAGIGFEWTGTEEILAKIDEEVAEVKQALLSGDEEDIKEELGDLLFAVVSLARYKNINPEISLTASNRKFIRRFRRMVELSENSGSGLEELTVAEMDTLWQKSKGSKKEQN